AGQGKAGATGGRRGLKRTRALEAAGRAPETQSRVLHAAAREEQHEQDEQDDPEAAAGVVTPSSAGGPRGQREYQQYDQQGCQQAHGAPPPNTRSKRSAICVLSPSDFV